MDGKLNTESLNKTIVSSKWDIKDTLDVVTLIRSYAIDDEEYNVETTSLNLQEFVYMNIRENIKDEMDSSEATNAFKKTKLEIHTLFKYFDCNVDGLISAENVYNGMKNMKKM